MDLRVGGRYKLSKKLGSGAFGEIFKGNDRQLFFAIWKSSELIYFTILE